MQIYSGKEPYMENKWQELREIEAQRSDIITKLKKIEEKKTSVSSEIYEKVKKEYDEKLKKVDEKMAANVDLIKEALENLKQEEEKLVNEEKEVKLEIEEVKLRYSIGEYDEESFNKLSEDNNENLNAVKNKLQTLRERKKWFEDFVIIQDIEETMEPKKPEPEVEVEELIETEKSESEVEVEEPIETEKTESEIKIEEHILEEKLPEEGTKLDELLVEEEAVMPEAAEEQKTTQEESVEPSKNQGKGVSCPKCGHLNTPDSWYCEKCGAEILDSPVSE